MSKKMDSFWKIAEHVSKMKKDDLIAIFKIDLALGFILGAFELKTALWMLLAITLITLWFSPSPKEMKEKFSQYSRYAWFLRIAFGCFTIGLTQNIVWLIKSAITG